ncbi:hypothetical protein J6590_099831 [Homalodisca vitripennis]|nr:hypothetical protein J6590_099831 [Homalodisca vitripennis]
MKNTIRSLETSLTLAAEAGNALLLENSQLKEQLNNLKLENSTLKKELDMYKTASENILELQATIKNNEDYIQSLTDKNSELLQEMSFIKKKAEKEHLLNEELIQQSDLENSNYNIKINQLQEELLKKSTLAESVESTLNKRIDILLANEEDLRKLINDHTLTKVTMESDLIYVSFSEA